MRRRGNGSENSNERAMYLSLLCHPKVSINSSVIKKIRLCSAPGKRKERRVRAGKGIMTVISEHFILSSSSEWHAIAEKSASERDLMPCSMLEASRLSVNESHVPKGSLSKLMMTRTHFSPKLTEFSKEKKGKKPCCCCLV